MVRKESYRHFRHLKKWIVFARTRLLRVRALFLMVIIWGVFLSSPSIQPASSQVDRLMIPMIGDDKSVYQGLFNTIVERSQAGVIKILVLPFALNSNPNSLTPSERLNVEKAAESQSLKIEDACEQYTNRSSQCAIILAPIYERADTLIAENLNWFSPDLEAVIILDGYPDVAAGMINGTPIEVAIIEAYDRGAIIVGSNSGSALLSANMLAGYTPGYDATSSLQFGAVDVWNSSERHGLPIGSRLAIIDHLIYSQSRFSRLLNAIALPESPHIGIGIDTSTGVLMPEANHLKGVFGLHPVTILDAETYRSAQAVRYRGADHLISMRNILFHTLSPGISSYDLISKTHSIAAPTTRLERRFDALSLPRGSPALFLAGHLNSNKPEHLVLERFKEVSGGDQARYLIVIAGIAPQRSSLQAADPYISALQGSITQIITLEAGTTPTNIPLPSAYDAVIFIGEDQELMEPLLTQLEVIRQAWEFGKPILADDAAAVVLGSYFTSISDVPDQNQSRIIPGLNLVNISVEPKIISNNRWVHLISMAYSYPQILHLAIPDDTAVEFTSEGARAIGENVVFVFDFSTATLSTGTNQGFVIANGLLDVFAPGENISPEDADTQAEYTQLPTPDLRTTTPTPTITATPPPTSTSTSQPTETAPPGRATRTPRPTATPLTIPPPSDPSSIQQMIGSGVVIVLVIVFGIWVNRKRIWKNSR